MTQYNGFSNWETWNLYNWIDVNDKRRNAAQDAMHGAESPAGALQEHVYNQMPDVEPSWWYDVLRMAVLEVNWQELADALADE
jgi:hypothetical protein